MWAGTKISATCRFRVGDFVCTCLQNYLLSLEVSLDTELVLPLDNDNRIASSRFRYRFLTLGLVSILLLSFPKIFMVSVSFQIRNATENRPFLDLLLWGCGVSLLLDRTETNIRDPTGYHIRLFREFGIWLTWSLPDDMQSSWRCLLGGKQLVWHLRLMR